jgi:hypothetical protein
MPIKIENTAEERERAVLALLGEVLWWHSDPTLAEYNGCDTEPCQWCECARGLLNKTMDANEIIKTIWRPGLDAIAGK